MSLAIRISHETQIRACREVPKLAAVRGHWEVQTYTLCDGWVNCWSIEEDGQPAKPETFTTREAASKALREHIADCILSVHDGDMEDAPSLEDFQIVFVEINHVN